VVLVLGLMLVLGFGLFALTMLGSLFFGSSEPSEGRLFGGFHFTSGPIALVKIDGDIEPGPLFDFWMESLKAIAKDQGIEGVILRLESPGGSVAASQELYDEVLYLRRKHGKTVYVSMGDLAASGAYYVAAAADRIFANRGSLTGSVGVISTTYRVEGLAEKAGVQVEVVKTGRFKDSGSMFRPMSDEDRRMFGRLLDDAYQQFIEDILREREERLAEALAEFQDSDWSTFTFQKPELPNPRKFLLQIADGRVYSGEQAKKLGLVDELGSLSQVVRRMAEDLGIRGETRVYEPRRRLSWLDFLTSKVRGAIPTPAAHPTLQYRMVSF
jgi:protease-4